MKLQLLIPQYKETEKTIKFMLNSIEQQLNIDFNKDFEVLIGNDGSDILLSKKFLQNYSFPIKYYKFQHTRLAGCRQKLFEKSTADYIMYCDADDAFISTIALSLIFNFIKDNFDILNCTFFEQHHKENGTFYVPHIDDKTFVHGKVYRRAFLIENNINWHQELYEHQDGCYTALALSLSKKTLNCNIPLYLWHNNPNSIARKDGELHIIKTFNHFLDAQTYLVNDYLEHKLQTSAIYHANYIMYYCYYIMMNNLWYLNQNFSYRNNTYARIAKFYRNFKFLLEKEVDQEKLKKILTQLKKILNEMYPQRLTHSLPEFEKWMQCILALY